MTKLIPVGKHAHALVDDEDFEALSQRKWNLKPGGRYAVTHGLKKKGLRKTSMHRMILQLPKGIECDHKNGNGLDNRRENLRICTRSQNNANQKPLVGKSSRFKGVYFDRGRWVARIKSNRKLKHLGSYGSEEEAALAYNIAALARFGEFARLNEIKGSPKQVAGIAGKLAGRRIRLARKRAKYGPGWMTVLELK